MKYIELVGFLHTLQANGKYVRIEVHVRSAK